MFSLETPCALWMWEARLSLATYQATDRYRTACPRRRPRPLASSTYEPKRLKVYEP